MRLPAGGRTNKGEMTMAKAKERGWTVRAIGVSYVNGERRERPLEDFSKEELREIAKRKNLEALAAAGFVPVEQAAG